MTLALEVVDLNVLSEAAEDILRGIELKNEGSRLWLLGVWAEPRLVVCDFLSKVGFIFNFQSTFYLVLSDQQNWVSALMYDLVHTYLNFHRIVFRNLK